MCTYVYVLVWQLRVWLFTSGVYTGLASRALWLYVFVVCVVLPSGSCIGTHLRCPNRDCVKPTYHVFKMRGKFISFLTSYVCTGTVSQAIACDERNIPQVCARGLCQGRSAVHWPRQKTESRTHVSSAARAGMRRRAALQHALRCRTGPRLRDWCRYRLGMHDHLGMPAS